MRSGSMKPTNSCFESGDKFEKLASIICKFGVGESDKNPYNIGIWVRICMQNMAKFFMKLYQIFALLKFHELNQHSILDRFKRLANILCNR